MTLCCHSLAEICDLNQSDIGQVLHIDRTTARYHLKKPIDIDAVKMVIARVSDQIEEEDLEYAKARTARLLVQ